MVDLRLTALRTLLSRGFLLGSLVEERIPVPQLLAKVFLQGYRVNTRGQSQQKPANNGTDRRERERAAPHCTTRPQMECESCFVTTTILSSLVLRVAQRRTKLCNLTTGPRGTNNTAAGERLISSHSPVKEGGEQAAQQDFVFDPGAQMTVHQLASSHEDLRAWRIITQRGFNCTDWLSYTSTINCLAWSMELFFWGFFRFTAVFLSI